MRVRHKLTRKQFFHVIDEDDIPPRLSLTRQLIESSRSMISSDPLLSVFMAGRYVMLTRIWMTIQIH